MLLFTFLALPNEVFAQGDGGDWYSPSSWPCNCVPTDHAVIPEGYVISIESSVDIGLVTVHADATLIIGDLAGLVVDRLSNFGEVVNGGTITIQDTYQGRPNTVYNGQDATFNISSSGALLIDDVFGGSAIVNFGDFENSGVIRITDTGIWPAIDNRENFYNENLLTITRANGIAIFSRGLVNNDGRIETTNIAREAISASFGSFTNGNVGSINHSGTGAGSIGLSDNVVFNNLGDINLFGAEDFLITCARGASINFTEGVIGGNGVIRWCNPTILGDISPGASPGQIIFDSNVSLSGEYEWEASGTQGQALAGGHDHIQVNGQMNFTGSININLINGYLPATGDRYEIITCQNGCNGDYSNLVATTDNWMVDVQGNSVWLEYREAVLPVELVSFTGVIDDKSHRLDWVVGQEDVAAYELYVSPPFASDWQIITSSPATGLVGYSATYLPVEAGIHAYRLKMVEHDGTFTFSDVVLLGANPLDMYLFPNPTFREFSISGLTTPTEKVQLYNSLGRLCREWTAGTTSDAYVLLDLPGGVYTVVVETGKRRESRRLILR